MGAPLNNHSRDHRVVEVWARIVQEFASKGKQIGVNRILGRFTPGDIEELAVALVRDHRSTRIESKTHRYDAMVSPDKIAFVNFAFQHEVRRVPTVRGELVRERSRSNDVLFGDPMIHALRAIFDVRIS